jgi:hypothetical protein
MEDSQIQLTDKTLNCSDCHQDFIFSVREQEFFAEMGFKPTRRCVSCRAKKRAEAKGTEQPGNQVVSSSAREELPPTGGKKKTGRGGRRNQNDYDEY